MSFYTIDGRFVNKKNVVEGFFDNKIIEHATFGIDTQETTNEMQEDVMQEDEPPMDIPEVQEDVMQEDVPPMDTPEVDTNQSNQETTNEMQENEPPMDTPEVETIEAPIELELETIEAPIELETNEIPMTNEMKEDKSMHMHFCINGKCLTGSELRKLNELYDKKCTN